MKIETMKGALEALGQQRQLYAKAAAESRSFDSKEYNENHALQIAIKDFENRTGENVAEAMDSRTQSTPFKADPQGGVDDTRTGSIASGPGTECRKMENLFGARAANGRNSGFEGLDQMMTEVASGLGSAALSRAAASGTGSDGGFLIPTEYSRKVWNHSIGDELVRPRATVVPMTSNEKIVPATVIGDHSSSLFGGVTASWKEEGSLLDDTRPKFRALKLQAKKLSLYGTASNEFLRDSSGAGDSAFRTTFMGALGWTIDNVSLRGNSGNITGIIDSPCTITQAKDSAQTADTISYTNLTGMLSKLHPALHKGAVFVVHPSCIPELASLNIGTDNHYQIISESNGSMKILSLPVVISEHASILGDEADVMLCNFSQLAIGMREHMRLDKSADVRFDYDEVAMRLISRLDIAPLWDEPMTLRDGSHEVSPFVVLAARA